MPSLSDIFPAPVQLLFLFVAAFGAIGAGYEAFAAEDERQYYEVRQYVVDDETDGAALDRYLSTGLLPALRRAGTGPVGIFGPAENADSPDRFVVIPYDRAEQIFEVQQALRADRELAAAKDFSADGPNLPPYKRIVSELAVAMSSMPQLKAPEGVGTEETRVYELRTYESPSKGLAYRKAEMFDDGEFAIFLETGIIPVFMGQTLVGPHTPSMTYLSAYADEAARVQAWKTFVDYPAWKKLSADPKYKGTVSKIHKYILRPLPGSQL